MVIAAVAQQPFARACSGLKAHVATSEGQRLPVSERRFRIAGSSRTTVTEITVSPQLWPFNRAQRQRKKEIEKKSDATAEPLYTHKNSVDNMQRQTLMLHDQLQIIVVRIRLGFHIPGETNLTPTGTIR